MPLIHASTKPVCPPDERIDPRHVVKWLSPIISDERKKRIERVIVRRLVSVTVVLENLYDPHNGAAALRSCEAFGLHHVHVVPNPENPFSFSRKVSQNAHKWLNVMLHPSIEACFSYLKRAGFSCWAAIPPPIGGSRKISDKKHIEVHKGPVAIVVGNEHSGLSDRANELSDHCFTIPLQGFTESLNLSVAVAVAVQDAVTRRRRWLGQIGDLPEDARSQLRAAYYAMSTPHATSVVLNHVLTAKAPSDPKSLP